MASNTSDPKLPPTSAELRRLRRLKRVNFWLWASAIPGLLVVAVTARLFVDSEAMRTYLAIGFLGLWFAAGAVQLFGFLRCPRCKASLLGFQAAAEWGQRRGEAARCPRCSLDLEGMT